MGLETTRQRLKCDAGSAAVGDLQSAKADVQEVYLEVNRLAGWLSMRTEELENTEELKSVIFPAAENTEPK